MWKPVARFCSSPAAAVASQASSKKGAVHRKGSLGASGREPTRCLTAQEMRLQAGSVDGGAQVEACTAQSPSAFHSFSTGAHMAQCT